MDAHPMPVDHLKFIVTTMTSFVIKCSPISYFLQKWRNELIKEDEPSKGFFIIEKDSERRFGKKS